MWGGQPDSERARFTIIWNSKISINIHWATDQSLLSVTIVVQLTCSESSGVEIIPPHRLTRARGKELAHRNTSSLSIWSAIARIAGFETRIARIKSLIKLSSRLSSLIVRFWSVISVLRSDNFCCWLWHNVRNSRTQLCAWNSSFGIINPHPFSHGWKYQRLNFALNAISYKQTNVPKVVLDYVRTLQDALEAHLACRQSGIHKFDYHKRYSAGWEDFEGYEALTASLQSLSLGGRQGSLVVAIATLGYKLGRMHAHTLQLAEAPPKLRNRSGKLILHRHRLELKLSCQYITWESF